jgi:hypothetical protein
MRDLGIDRYCPAQGESAAEFTDNPKDNLISKGYVKVVEDDGRLALHEKFRNNITKPLFHTRLKLY